MSSVANQLRQQWMTQAAQQHLLQNQSTNLERNRLAHVPQNFYLAQQLKAQFTFNFPPIYLTRIQEPAKSHAGFVICWR
jgi:hypothetical protein